MHHDACMWLVFAERLVVTGTMSLSFGSVDAGPHDGYAMPGGHFDVGVTLSRFRVAAELDASAWVYEDAPDEMEESGSFTRLGGSLRYYFLDIDIAGPQEEFSLMRMYMEAGLGRHTIDSASVDVTRRDVSFGIGTQQQSVLSGMTVGGRFGVRAVIADAPAQAVACRGACDARRRDIAVFFTMGFAVGK